LNKKLKNINHECDFCVVGGGIAGMCAAIAAARHGLKVVIIHDRPMYGGNASSEVRMWISGAHGDNNRETGILEEISLENMYRNPYRGYPVWDSILFEFIKNEENIVSLLNCTCNDCQMDGEKIVTVTGWQMTTQTYHTVSAEFFADCSGDSILAPLSGAEYYMGREERERYNESIAPITADKKTMGHSCLIQARETNEKRKFIPPDWAYKFTKEELKNRYGGIEKPGENFWYLEIGGTRDTIADTEEIRDELLSIAYGIWDYIKNSGECNADNWELDWVGYLPGKRESRRYIGEYIMNQNDIEGGGKFEDTVAYGGWSMDDHNPDGIFSSELPTIYHPAPSPFGIPYRSLYSKNISNLFFAGRNISVTHSALSATRVMGTCATIGQAVGTAAWVAVIHKLLPHEVYQNKLELLKQTLMEDDCYLPGNKMKMSEIIENSEIKTNGVNGEKLRNGVDRKVGNEENCWRGKLGSFIEIKFDKSEDVKEIKIVLDSDLNRKTIGGGDHLVTRDTVSNIPLGLKPIHLPTTLVKDIKIEFLSEKGEWEEELNIKDNRKRVLKCFVDKKCSGVRITPVSSYGDHEVNIFSINIK